MSNLPTSHGGITQSSIIQVAVDELAVSTASAVTDGLRLGLLTARRTGEGYALVTLLLDPKTAQVRVLESALTAPNTHSFPSITPRVPQAHWFERAVCDLYGLRPTGHPRFKSLILHDSWPVDLHPLADPDLPASEIGNRPREYRFLTVAGDGVYEIPVGPIHAGIIEMGHFRFSCLGEVIQNLEIRLGYQHRGIEEHMERTQWRKARFLAEAASSDTSSGNALAHALAIEQLLSIEAPPAAVALRAIALEIERVACHIGDLGGICGDIGYAGGAAIFGRIRGRALGLGERLTGSRFQTAYILPGGVARCPTQEMRSEMLAEASAIAREFTTVSALTMDNSGVLERVQTIGTVRPSLAADFGMVGPSGRASGIDYDVRKAMAQTPYDRLDWTVPTSTQGDVFARVGIKVDETRISLDLIKQLLIEPLDNHEFRVQLQGELPPLSVGVGIVEAWRGELIHLIFTNESGQIGRYCIKDPSFNNWTGLSIAARGQLVGDFPLCNKSFGLSYSGNDL